MIGITGKYLCKFKLANIDNFIREDQLIMFKLIEETGNVLPLFELVFSLSNNFELEKFLNNGNYLDVTFGKDLNNLESIRLYIFDTTKSSVSNNSRMYRTVGVGVSLTYNSECFVKTYGGKSVDVIKEIAGKYFKVIDETDGSDDEMNWIQPNTNNRKFINELWLHSTLKDKTDTLLVGINASGEFRMRSMIKALSNPAEFTFTSTSIDSDKTFVYESVPSFQDDRGFSSAIGGQPKSTLLHDSSQNVSMYATPEKINTMVNGDQGVSGLGKRVGKSRISNQNMHSNYQLSYDYNVRNLLMLQSTKAKVTFNNQTIPVNLLDTVLLKTVDNQNSRSASEVDSGVWFVDKKARIIANKELKTIITLCRDGSNGQEEIK